MPCHASRDKARGILVTFLFISQVTTAQAQEIEPRAYSNAPIGVNFLIAGYAFTRGALATDSSALVTNAELTTSSAVLGYAHVLDLWGQSAKFDVILPAPALTLKEFANYQQDLIVGTSLQISAPLGQYDDRKLVNLGTNRWSFKPEIGVSKAWGAWTLELAGAVTLFTDNQDFFNGRTRSQDPLYSIQGHVIHAFPAGVWASLDATFFTGGSTRIDGTPKDDRQRNWRLGGTLALPVNTRNSVKLYASSGVSARTGNNYDLLGIAWQYRWGGGL